jgi:hypothetical protein
MRLKRIVAALELPAPRNKRIRAEYRREIGRLEISTSKTAILIGDQ